MRFEDELNDSAYDSESVSYDWTQAFSARPSGLADSDDGRAPEDGKWQGFEIRLIARMMSSRKRV